jgi:hypothetical protein
MTGLSLGLVFQNKMGSKKKKKKKKDPTVPVSLFTSYEKNAHRGVWQGILANTRLAKTWSSWDGTSKVDKVGELF